MAVRAESEVPQVLLASGSPRRVELLEMLGITPIVAPADTDETPNPGEPAELLVERLACQKAIAGWDRWRVGQDAVERSPSNGAETGRGQSGWMVIAADTVVEIDGSVLGKPEDAPAAEAMLRRLSGVSHRVHSGVAVGLVNDMADRLKPVSCVALTDVVMRNLDLETIRWYVETGEPMDKAGAYGIQGKGAVLVDHINGSYPNVVGLPLALVDVLTRRFGWPLQLLSDTANNPAEVVG